jgi:hypothetical protein
MSSFLLGALALGFFAVALFFLRFYQRTSDRFFACFGVAFGIMSANQIALAAWGEASESHSWLYLVRLAAFAVILYAIFDKNRR